METKVGYAVRLFPGTEDRPAGKIHEQVSQMRMRRMAHGFTDEIEGIRVSLCEGRPFDNFMEGYCHKPEGVQRKINKREEAGGTCFLVEVYYNGDEWTTDGSQVSYLVLGTKGEAGDVVLLYESHPESLDRSPPLPCPALRQAKEIRKKIRGDLHLYGPIELTTHPSKTKVRESWLRSPWVALEWIPGAMKNLRIKDPNKEELGIVLSTPRVYDRSRREVRVAAATVLYGPKDDGQYQEYFVLLSGMEYDRIVRLVSECGLPPVNLPTKGKPAVQINVSIALGREPTANQVRDALHEIADKSRDCLYDQYGSFQPCESLQVPMKEQDAMVVHISVDRAGDNTPKK